MRAPPGLPARPQCRPLNRRTPRQERQSAPRRPARPRTGPADGAQPEIPVRHGRPGNGASRSLRRRRGALRCGGGDPDGLPGTWGGERVPGGRGAEPAGGEAPHGLCKLAAEAPRGLYQDTAGLISGFARSRAQRETDNDAARMRRAEMHAGSGTWRASPPGGGWNACPSDPAGGRRHWVPSGA